MKNIGIVTLYRGYNYGTSLQAFAIKQIVNELGYNGIIIWKGSGLTKGRDIRIDKILKLIFLGLIHPIHFMRVFKGYKDSFDKKMDILIKNKFLDFSDKYLNVMGLSNKDLKSFARRDENVAFICGSDQIWNCNSLYLEPLYYLRFAPEYKRISYAPSLGGTQIRWFNKRRLCRYLKQIPYISVREHSGKEIIKKVSKRNAFVALDPTFLIDWHKFTQQQETKRKFAVIYFLNKPATIAIDYINNYCKANDLDLYCFPYAFSEFTNIAKIKFVYPGPIDFVNIISKCEFVFTDSYHGTIFSIIFKKKFFVFDRNYANKISQSTRITSLLNEIGLSDRFIKFDRPLSSFENQIDYENAYKIIEEMRKKSIKYLINSINAIEDKND